MGISSKLIYKWANKQTTTHDKMLNIIFHNGKQIKTIMRYHFTSTQMTKI